MGLLPSTVIKVVVILEMFAAVVDRSSVVVVVRWNVYVFFYLVLTDLAVSFYVTGEASTPPVIGPPLVCTTGRTQHKYNVCR